MTSILAISLLSAHSVNAEVKYKDLQVGDTLYTRNCLQDPKKGWVYRFVVKTIDDNGVALGSSEKATVTDEGFRELVFSEKIASESANLSEICEKGGCYTKEEEAFADLKKWMVFGCPSK